MTRAPAARARTSPKPEPLPSITVVRAVKHKVSMNNYEGIEIFASVSTEVPGESDMAEVRGRLDSMLDTLVESDLIEAVNTTAEKKTYAQFWREGN